MICPALIPDSMLILIMVMEKRAETRRPIDKYPHASLSDNTTRRRAVCVIMSLKSTKRRLINIIDLFLKAIIQPYCRMLIFAGIA